METGVDKGIVACVDKIDVDGLLKNEEASKIQRNQDNWAYGAWKPF